MLYIVLHFDRSRSNKYVFGPENSYIMKMMTMMCQPSYRTKTSIAHHSQNHLQTICHLLLHFKDLCTNTITLQTGHQAATQPYEWSVVFGLFGKQYNILCWYSWLRISSVWLTTKMKMHGMRWMNWSQHMVNSKRFQNETTMENPKMKLETQQQQ